MTNKPVLTYPWHHGLWATLRLARQQQRLPHALLLSGKPGMGKSAFAQRLAHALLCMQPTESGDACGQCKACHWLETGNHPDFQVLQPEEPGKPIKIEQIRELIAFSALTAHSAQERVVILQPAEAMNVSAANSLLKILEEPPPATRLVLLTHQPAGLLATIRSRCQQFYFSPAQDAETLNWLSQALSERHSDLEPHLLLKLADYAPLAALALLEQMSQREQVREQVRLLLNGKQDPIHIANEWGNLPHAQLLNWLSGWLMDIIRCQQGSTDIRNQDMQELLQRLATRLPGVALFQSLDTHQEMRRLCMASSNVKLQGLLETLACCWEMLGQQARQHQ